MTTESLAAALEREHSEIDRQFAAFTAATTPDQRSEQSLTRAVHRLRRHIYLEEEFLFPFLLQAEPELATPVAVMLREHAQIWATLEALRHALAAGAGAELGLCRQLTVQLLHHNLTEEKALYPRADEALPPALASGALAFLDAGELPEGWVCMRARPGTGTAGR